MSDYKVPMRDIKFAMDEVLAMPQHYAELPGAEEVTSDLVGAVISEAGKFCENVIAPLNQSGDEQGCQWQDGKVTTPEGFKEAYDQFTENGWVGLSFATEIGGQGLPPSIASVCSEMYSAANHSWAMYTGLSQGAVSTIHAHCEEHVKQRFLPKLVQGTWTGTMCLTEPHCGSDLGLLRTKAEPNGDGTYNITGTKIFISSGEHDLADNIIHVVLARLPDSPPGIGGISLFIVPKISVDENGELGENNNVSCGSIESKMGIHGNSTCVMNFDGAKGYLAGTPNKGMSCMFTFINESRLGVAQQGLAHIQGSYQNAAAYAAERLQMRAPKPKNPDQQADPIIVHPDVRRMLLTQKAFAEGGRLLNYYCAKQVDLSHQGTVEQQEAAETLLALLTPIAKGFLTEASQEATSHGIQVFGGHGYIKEWGQEQHYRDARITQLYEGTSGIQGLDLLGRKILSSRGKIMEPFVMEIKAFCAKNADSDLAKVVNDSVDQWVGLTMAIGKKAMANPDEVNAAAYDYLMFAGYICLAYFLAQGAIVAQQALDSGSQEVDYYQSRLAVAAFYFERILPRTQTHAVAIKSGCDNLMRMTDENFAI